MIDKKERRIETVKPRQSRQIDRQKREKDRASETETKQTN